ncbi:MAG: HPr family phosphocarrier protein [Candidatus Latescibacteria bacterium]|nr:HPr family phosphocarrier protein [Candidatus Latescibacterota bacterium]
MISTAATVSDPVGFHLRAAGRIVKLAKTFDAEVTVRFQGRVANAKSIMGLASLAADCGSVVELEVEGPDDAAAAAALVRLIEVDLAHPEVPEG